MDLLCLIAYITANSPIYYCSKLAPFDLTKSSDMVTTYFKIFCMLSITNYSLRFYNPLRKFFICRYSTFSSLSLATSDAIVSFPRSYDLITKSHELLKAVDNLQSCSEIAVDLEFDRNSYSYGFTLCLVQIYDGRNKVYLVDPITSKLDLSPLYRQVFENKKVLKVLHSPSEDLRLLRSQNCNMVNLFDTERCAKLLNYQYTSLLYLLNSTLDIEINKSEQRSNWIKRPLSQSQLDYAKEDVLHLIRLKNKLIEKGTEKGIIQWIQEENDDWTDTKLNADSTEGDDAQNNILYTKKDQKMFSPYQLHVLNAILLLRDKYAKLTGKPPFYIISKDNMNDIIFNLFQVTKPDFYAQRPLPVTTTSSSTNSTVQSTDLLLPRKELNIHLIKGGIHPKLREAKVAKEFELMYQETIKEADELKLSKIVVKANDSLIDSKDWKLLLDIKYKISDWYGNFTANYIMTVGMMLKMTAINDTSTFLTDPTILPYKKRLISTVIEDLKIDPFIKK